LQRTRAALERQEVRALLLLLRLGTRGMQLLRLPQGSQRLAGRLLGGQRRRGQQQEGLRQGGLLLVLR
jgi:hypothetical protein